MINNPEKSLCWKCKHGVCLQETQDYLEQDIQKSDYSEKDPFNIYSNEYVDEETKQQIYDLKSFESVKTICFWRPSGIEHAPPIACGFVSKCSRFEKR